MARFSHTTRWCPCNKSFEACLGKRRNAISLRGICSRWPAVMGIVPPMQKHGRLPLGGVQGSRPALSFVEALRECNGLSGVKGRNFGNGHLTLPALYRAPAGARQPERVGAGSECTGCLDLTTLSLRTRPDVVQLTLNVTNSGTGTCRSFGRCRCWTGLVESLWFRLLGFCRNNVDWRCNFATKCTAEIRAAVLLLYQTRNHHHHHHIPERFTCKLVVSLPNQERWWLLYPPQNYQMSNT